MLTLHHIVTEGWAMDIFARELGALYEAFVDERESPLAPLPVQYLDYSVWQRQWLESGERQRQLDYWTAQLGNEHPLLELPATVRGRRCKAIGELYRFDLSADLAARVRAFNANRPDPVHDHDRHPGGVALPLQRPERLAHRRAGGQPHSPGKRRADRGVPQTQVLRCQLDGQMRVGELFEQVRHTVIEGQSHQDLPFDHLVEALHRHAALPTTRCFR